MANIPRQTLHRLLLAKGCIRDAKRASSTSSNDLTLSQTVVYLHDAIDNLLGAIASNAGVRLAPKDALMDVYTKIETTGTVLGDRADINQLNTMRNAIKHQGVPQNAAAVLALLPIVHTFANRVCQQAFAVTLDAVSLIDLVDDAPTRSRLEDIQRLLDRCDFKVALEQMAITLFLNFESWRVEVHGWWRRDNEGVPLLDQRFVFPKERYGEKTLECLEMGIDPDELTRFEWLTPKVGYDNLHDKNIVLAKKELFWHEKNWTYPNAIFCFNFLVNFLVARQKSPDAPSVVRRDTKKNRFRFVVSSTLSDSSGVVLRSYSAGDEIICHAEQYVEGSWQNHGYSAAYVEVYEGANTIKGFITKADVVVGADYDEAFR